MRKNGQYATEFMLTAAAGILLVTVAAFVLYNEFGNQMQSVNIAQIQKFGNSVVNAASKLSYYGQTSVITISGNMPGGVSNISVENNRTLVIAYNQGGKPGKMKFISPIDLATDFNDYNQGAKDIVVRFKGDYVSVCEKSFLRCNNFCDHTTPPEGGVIESYLNTPNDCCTEACNGCSIDASPSICASTSAGHDSTCHPACYGHNGCKTIC